MSQSNAPASRSQHFVGYAVLAALSAVGVGAIGYTLFQGHEKLATTQHVPWGLWVALYIFFLGLSAGSFLLSSLVYVFRIKRLEPAGPIALVQALLCLVLGGLLVILDLGHPARIYLVLTSMNPTSVMAWMGIFYNLYIAVVLVELYLVFRPHFVERASSGGRGARWYRRFTFGRSSLDVPVLERDRWWLRTLGIVGIPVAIIVSTGVGVLFAVAKARPGWFSGLFPIIFLITALASGAALTTLFVSVFSKLPVERKRELVRTLALLSVAVLGFDFLLLASEVLVTFYGNVPHESSGWRLVLFGPYWWVFWFVQLGVGAVVPIAILIGRRTSRAVPWLAAAGLAIVVGILGARMNLVIPAQIEPAFQTLPEAYHHERFALGYYPSLLEWLVALGVVTLGVWAFILARRLLPLAEAEAATQAGGGLEP